MAKLKILLVICFFFVLNQLIAYDFSLTATKGISHPMFSYSSTSNSDNFWEIANKAKQAYDFQLGLNDNTDNLIFKLGISINKYNLNKQKLIQIYQDKNYSQTSYLNRNFHYQTDLYVNLSKKLTYKKMIYIPGLIGGISFWQLPEETEIYYFNENNEIIIKKNLTVEGEYRFKSGLIFGISNDFKFQPFSHNRIKFVLTTNYKLKIFKMKYDIVTLNANNSKVSKSEKNDIVSLHAFYFGLGVEFNFDIF